MSRYLIGLDIGGTKIKSSIIDIDNPTNKICEEFFTSFPVDSLSLSYEEIIKVLISIFKTMYKIADANNFPILGIGVATPGPFEHEKGISRMQHKYKSLYGVNLKDVFRNILNKPPKYPIFFDDDCRAFLLGEALYGSAQGYSRCIGITIGTGLGAGFMVNKCFFLEGKGVPPRGQVWALPCQNGVVDDIVSKRGIINLYKKLIGTDAIEIEVKNIAERAYAGDASAKKAFAEMGKTLGKTLKPIVDEFEAECLILGGNISRSYSLFADSLIAELKALSSLKKIAQATSIDLSVFYALAYKYKQIKEENI